MFMNWKFLIQGSFKPLFKCSSFGWASVLDKGIDESNALINMGVSSYLNHQSQKSLMEQSQQWQEDMYNKYQSPEALMRQYKSSGLNPFLLGENVGTGSIPSVPSAPSGSTSPLSPGGSPLGQAEYVAAVGSNQRAMMVMNSIQAINEAYIKGGIEAGDNMLRQLMPEFDTRGIKSHQVALMTADVRLSTAAKREVDQIEANWQKKYGFDLRSTQFMKLNQEIDSLVASIGLMSTQAELNKSQRDKNYQDIKESVSRIARNFAEVYKLKKEGDYYVANTETANQIRSYVVSKMVLDNGINALQYLSNQTSYGIQQAGAEIKRKQASDPVLQGVKFALETLGNVIHI